MRFLKVYIELSLQFSKIFKYSHFRNIKMLEQLFPPSWIERKEWFAFVLGLSYAVLGIGSALLLFPKEPGLAAVAFTSLLALPSLNKLLTMEERQAAREKRF